MKTITQEKPKYDRKVQKFIKMFQCDSARISDINGKLFLIIGHKRNTKDDPGQWIDEKGEIRHWDYLLEQVVASGKSAKELMASAKQYKKFCGMTMGEYLNSLISKSIAKAKKITP